MARKKFGVSMEIFSEYAQKLLKAGSMDYLKETTENALIESKEYVTKNLEADAERHHRTGRMESSLDRDSDVEWKGSLASIKVGFKISEGGLPSIFLMYGTPRIRPADKKMYNDVYGTATSRKVFEIQRKVFDEALRKVMEE